jgi:hypothetical protein
MIIELGKVTEETKHPLNPTTIDNTMGDFGFDL